MTRNPHIWFLVSSLYFLSSFSCSSTSMYLLLFLVVVFLNHVLEVFRVSDFGLNRKQVLFHLIDFLIFEISQANVAVAPFDLLWLGSKPETWFWLWRSLLGLVVRQSVILKLNLEIFCFATCIFYSWRETRFKILAEYKFFSKLFYLLLLKMNMLLACTAVYGVFAPYTAGGHGVLDIQRNSSCDPSPSPTLVSPLISTSNPHLTRIRWKTSCRNSKSD